ncbi:NAD-dependent epimerase/dehydratase family protein [Nakamurella sp.]|uniref:NAD-dependent epimerase/dehydratase family protein n=1 Tax=Nakamurella sp. TaxID=1869182 RepID=UPI003783F661
MKALVVGGAGDTGSVVTRLLMAQDHEVVVPDDCATGHADALPAGASFRPPDITAR